MVALGNLNVHRGRLEYPLGRVQRYKEGDCALVSRDVNATAVAAAVGDICLTIGRSLGGTAWLSRLAVGSEHLPSIMFAQQRSSVDCVMYTYTSGAYNVCTVCRGQLENFTRDIALKSIFYAGRLCKVCCRVYSWITRRRFDNQRIERYARARVCVYLEHKRKYSTETRTSCAGCERDYS